VTTDQIQVAISTLPATLTYDDAVELAYREDLDWIEEKLRSRLSVLIECDKQLSNYIYKALRRRFRGGEGPRLKLLSGHPRSADPANPMQNNMTLTQRLLEELREAIYGAADDSILVMTHLDILTTTTRSALNVEAREAAAIMYENPDLVFLGFRDPGFEIPAVIEKVFTVKYQLIGIARDKLTSLITQREARKFGVETLNPFTLYKYVSGLNAVRVRQVFAQLEGRIDYDPAAPQSVDAIYRDIRKLTLVGDLDVPRVDLERDIGGYLKVKEKIRTEILQLLAMKERSASAEQVKSIEEIVPRGMIFEGPPGTGKTFFAKAIATALNATVSVVSGPELKSKWVGESLPWEEEVLVIVDGKPKRMPIGELVEDHEGRAVQAWTVDDAGRSFVSDVTGFITHDGPDYIDVLVTETGREVRVTGGHSLFVAREGKIAEVFAEEVIAGETRIGVPLRLKAPETLASINLLDHFAEAEDVHVQGAGVDQLLQRAERALGAAQFELVAGRPLAAYLGKGRRPMTAAVFMRVMSAAQLEPDPAQVELYCWHRNKPMSALLELTPELGEFLGLWTADGCYNEHGGVRISTNDVELRAAKSLCERFAPHVTCSPKGGRGVDLIMTSTLLKRVMQQVLGMVSGSDKKRVPAAIFMAPRPTVAAFLRGYFSGDGTFSGKYIEATTVSRGLAADVATLLQYFGIAPRLQRKPERGGRDATRVRFLWSEFLRTFEREIGFMQSSRNTALNQYLSGMRLKRSKQTPAVHISGDILWDKVVEVRREPYTRPHVYDLSVPETERFIAGFGNILVHNSEENLRRVFAQARKSAPAIIIFDEIDSFATARGTYTGSGVEHSMVNQLLTEMDGFRKEELVFIVATTNFAESLDPALLRPGRFELIIEIPYPDKDDRKAILEIYRKKFGLDIDDEILDYMVQRTGGFVDYERGIRFSGDHIYALMRGLKREQLRRGGELKVTREDVDKALGGKKDKKKKLTPEEERTVALHEAGHAILAYTLPDCPTVERITIASEEEDYLGYVMHAVAKHQHVRTQRALEDSICVALGGRMAEQLFLGVVSSGCWNDLQQATAIASLMVEELGMSRLGVRALKQDGGDQAVLRGMKLRSISDATAERVDEEVSRIIQEQNERAKSTIEQFKAEYDKLVEVLVEKKTIGLEEMKAIFNGRTFKSEGYKHD
jgi:ATP-dependent Zn protease/intein/homing endonuclease